MIPKPSQDFVPVKEVRDGVAILQDNSMRMILMTSSLNFALKSTDEQEAIIFQFQNFLNSLDFSVQISIQSRKLDIKPYIALLQDRQKEQVNDLMRIQVKEYIQFIKTFTEGTNIMTKSFFIVIPYSPAKLDVRKGFSRSKKPEDRAREFEENKSQLEQRVAIVEQGVIRCGIRTVRLGTEEIIEIFYKIFNPGDVEKPIPLEQ